MQSQNLRARKNCLHERAQKPFSERRLQTEKARIKKQLKSQAEKLQRQNENAAQQSFGAAPKPVASYAEHLRHWFFTPAFVNVQKQENVYKKDDWKTYQKDRARGVFCLIRALVTTINSLFTVSPSQSRPEIFHTLNVHTVDDTSTRMRPPSRQNDSGVSVYTIMNSVQNLHIRYEKSTGGCLSLRVPTPLVCLEQATATEIHKAFISIALVTARGVGDMLHACGIEKDVIDKTSQWKTFVFMGDALPANDASFRREAQLLSSSNKRNHLALRLKCGIHQIALVRKVAVLMVPKFWSTVVRMSHLFEVFSFRRSFAYTLASILCKSFVYIPVSTMPPGSSSWKAAASVIEKSFTSNSVLRRKKAASCLQFLNGNLNSDTVVHYCVGDCCGSQEESLTKCLQMVVPFLSRGFPVPLLYRFKHYQEAASYITFGTRVHNLLPRCLINMNLSKDVASAAASTVSETQGLIEELMSGMDLANAGADGTAATMTFAQEHAEFFESFQAQAAKRKQLVQQEVSKPGFRDSTAVVDALISPMDHAINKLLKHSEGLNKLTLLGEHNTGWKALSDKSTQFFCSVMSGDFGWDILGEYSSMITSGLDGLLGINVDSTELRSWQPVFVLLVHCVTDTWRRFIHDHKAFQFQMFSLLGLDLSCFVSQWDLFQAAHAKCAKCFDKEFSGAILSAYPGALSNQSPGVQESVRHTVQLLLGDLACHSPCSSDAVEIKNGQIQHISSSRGNMAVKTPVATKESALLLGMIRQHQLQKHFVEEKTLPSRKTVSSILKRVGQTSRNQHSFASGKRQPCSRTVPCFFFQSLLFFSRQIILEWWQCSIC